MSVCIVLLFRDCELQRCTAFVLYCVEAHPCVVLVCAQHFIDLTMLSNLEAVTAVRNQGVDVLIDLNGHTQVCVAHKVFVRLSLLVLCLVMRGVMCGMC